jgi:hypothetical protein
MATMDAMMHKPADAMGFIAILLELRQLHLEE